MSNLTAFFQTTPGQFASQVLPLQDVILPQAVTAADLDGDGDLDLALANDAAFSSQGSVTVYFQIATGQFDPQPVSLGVGISAQFLTAADIDGDGALDLVAAGAFFENTLRIYFQVTPGSFDPQPLELTHPLMMGPGVMTAADLDGDGDLDLASANNNTLTVFFQTTPGVFDPEPLFLSVGSGSTGLGSPRSVAAHDLDGDGDLDLVAAAGGTANGSVAIFFQTAPGQFDDARGLGEPFGLSEAVTAADFDGDGDLDLVSAGAELDVFFQVAPGRFAPEPLTLGALGTANRWVIAPDLDGDGDPDVVSVDVTRIGFDRLVVHWGDH